MPIGLVIAVAVVVTLIIVSTLGSRKMEKAKLQNLENYSMLKERAYEEIPDVKDGDLSILQFVSDTNRCYLLCKNSKKDIIAVVSNEYTKVMKISSKRSCEVEINRINNSAFDNVKCVIECDELDSPFEVVFVEKQHGKNSFFGKIALKNAQLFKDVFSEK